MNWKSRWSEQYQDVASLKQGLQAEGFNAEAGTQLVWVIKPPSKTVTVYRSETDITVLTRNDTLSGGEVVKGFSYEVAALFE